MGETVRHFYGKDNRKKASKSDPYANPFTGTKGRKYIKGLQCLSNRKETVYETIRATIRARPDERAKREKARQNSLGRRKTKEHTARRCGDAMHPTCRHMKKRGNDSPWFGRKPPPEHAEGKPKTVQHEKKTCTQKNAPHAAVASWK